MRKCILIKKRTLMLFPLIFLVAIQFYDEVPILQYIDSTGLKHILLLMFIFFSLSQGNKGNNISFPMGYELKRVCFVTIILVLISFIFMLENGYSTGWISETYFMIIPILFVNCLFRDRWNEDALEELADLFLVSSIIGFAMHILNRLQQGNILSFSFIDSSSPFEVESAHVFLLLYIIYTYLDKKKKRILSALCCILAWKRMALIYLIFVTFFNKRISKSKKIPKVVFICLTIIVLLLPLLLELLLTDAFSNWITLTFGIDLHKFLMFRFETIITALESTKPNQGLGSFLLVDVPWYDHYVNVSIHNDIIRLYLEVTPIGLACFSYGYLSLVQNQYSFLVMGFMFIEMIFSHFLGNGSLPFWILAFSMICCFNRFQTEYNDV